MTTPDKYPILSRVDFPADLRKLSVSELIGLSKEVREYIIETITKTGGHLAPSLGAVDLTIALHYVFNTPTDKLIWDVGHQAYGHKILTGRKEAIKNIRQYGGISGFCKITESEYDVFGAGHASTSISAAVGIASARDLSGANYRVCAIIGDGSFTGGLAYEGLNNAYNINKQFLVILNDNEMSISRNVGAMSNYFTRIVTSPEYLNFKNQVWNTLALLPRGTSVLRKIGRKLLESLKNFLAPGILFEEFGFRYYGPVDGHNIPQLITTLNNIKNLQYPVLLHVITQKGKGLSSAEIDPTKYHGISPRPAESCIDQSSTLTPPFLYAFGKIACEMAAQFDKVIFITAAMAEGTGLVEYSHLFPTRYYDVGIAEEHAVTFAAGLAASGFQPVVAIYSTFLQRAYDQIVHDVALQNLPVIFVLDRAGIVGEDGPTHHGNFDLSYLSSVPNLIVTAPRTGDELRDLLFTAMRLKPGPFAIRYPKDHCSEFTEGKKPETVEVGKWKILKEGERIAIISVGPMSNVALDASCIIEQKHSSPTIVHALYIKPYDKTLLAQILQTHSLIVVVEENSEQGGLGTVIAREIALKGCRNRLLYCAIPDRFIEQGARHLILEKLGLTAGTLAERIIKFASQPNQT